METETSVIFLPDGTVVLPGGIDTHVHSRVPDGIWKEDYLTLTKAGPNGGMTTLIDMPNSPALADTPDKFFAKQRLAEKGVYSRLGFHFLATPESIPYFEQVKNEAIAYKLFMNQSTGRHLVMDPRPIFAAIPEGKILMVHAEGSKLEEAIKLAKEFGTKLHVCHITTAEEVCMVDDAKESKVDISAGVTPHHLALNQADVSRLGPFALMLPRLGTQDDQETLIEGLKDGAIDQIESDHAPHTEEEKLSKTTFNGVPVVEQIIPLLFTFLKQGIIDDIDQIVKWTHTNPKNRFNIPVDPGDKIYIDTDHRYRVKQENLFSKSAASNPFLGWLMEAAVIHVELGGIRTMQNRVFNGERRGSVIRPLTRV